MNPSLAPDDNRLRDWGLALFPACLALGIFAIYLISPEFYLRYILERDLREFQAVELSSFGIALIAAGVLATAAWRVWRVSPPGRPEAALFVAGVAAAAFFFAGEEVNWGQILMHWGTAESSRPIEGQVNLHNTDIPIQSMGSKFLILVFFITPAVWPLLRSALKLPKHWALAVPRWPVVAAVATSFCLRPIKLHYLETRGETVFYLQFLEQINEVQELLIAVGFLIYGLDRLAAARAVARRRLQPPVSDADAVGAKTTAAHAPQRE
jgi:hypothetical protein